MNPMEYWFGYLGTSLCSASSSRENATKRYWNEFLQKKNNWYTYEHVKIVNIVDPLGMVEWN